MNRTFRLLLVSLALCLLIFWLGGAWKRTPSQEAPHDFYGNDTPGDGAVSFGSSGTSKADSEYKAKKIEHANYCRWRAAQAIDLNDLSSAQSWLNQAVADERAAR